MLSFSLLARVCPFLLCSGNIFPFILETDCLFYVVEFNWFILSWFLFILVVNLNIISSLSQFFFRKILSFFNNFFNGDDVETMLSGFKSGSNAIHLFLGSFTVSVQKVNLQKDSLFVSRGIHVNNFTFPQKRHLLLQYFFDFVFIDVRLL